DIGYVHTGFEKNFEQKTYWKGIPYALRMDYVAFFATELAYVGAVEKLIGIEVAERAQWIRTLFAELNRIHSHLIYLGTAGVAMGLSGPKLRASGVPYERRRVEPYLAYPDVEFEVVTGERGDAYERFLCRTNEMYESVRIVEQCLEKMPGGPVMANDRKYVLPPRAELHTSMESLIHHFKLVTEGFRVQPGQVYYPVESPRGEFGCYLVSDGGAKPWRAHFRAPSFVALQSTAMMSVNRYVGDMIVVVGSLDGVMGGADR